jgi:DNA-binding transcriptional regulator YdaS (Cro superfamily)
MKLAQYMRTLSPDQKRAYAKRAGTTVAYLKQLAGKHSVAGPQMARRLSAASDGKVELHEIRPDIWGRVHSELRA